MGVDDEKIDNAQALSNAIGLRASGDNVDITYIRDGRTRHTTAKLRQRQVTRSAGQDIHPGLAGADFATSTASTTGGIEVTSVAPDSPAAQRGLRSGDIITAVNRRPVRSIRDLTEIAGGSRVLVLLVRRGDRTLMLPIR